MVKCCHPNRVFVYTPFIRCHFQKCVNLRWGCLLLCIPTEVLKNSQMKSVALNLEAFCDAGAKELSMNEGVILPDDVYVTQHDHVLRPSLHEAFVLTAMCNVVEA